MTGSVVIGAAQTGRFTSRRSRLRTGTALVAGLAVASFAGGAHAQGFNGTPTSVTGAAVNGTNDDVTVFGSEAIITWTANAAAITDTNVDFLPAGNTVTFHDPGSPVGDFTVLNRIIPSYFDIATSTQTNLAATISLSGTVNSNVSGGNGGNIWFYSPYGIIVGAAAQFNVGSLLLTTSDIDTSNGGSLYLSQAAGNQIGFLPATQANAFVRILPGAQITASDYSPNSAYVGIFAPRIEQGGSIRSDAMNALVAAEAGTITFNVGLIDIQVTQGTDESQGNGIVHTGSTGGAASTGEPQTLALVAIPKNNALTMLLGGAIGYDAATVAIPDPSGVILSAGYQPTASAADLAAGLGNMRIGNTVFTSPTMAYATGTLDVLPQFLGAATPGLVDFQNDASLIAGRQINLVAGAGEEIRGGGSLFLAPLLPLQGEDVSITVTGNAAISPTNGLIDVTGDFVVDASGTPAGLQGPPPVIGADGRGGNITVAVSQGRLSAGNNLAFVVDGIGQDADVVAGNGFGGSIDIGVTNLGTVSAPFFSASAYGGGGFGMSAGNSGGSGTGGLIDLHDDGGVLNLGDVSLSAQGEGLDGDNSGGDATGGRISLTIAGGMAQTWTSLTADSSAIGGAGNLASGSATALNDGLNLHVTGAGSSLTVDSLQFNSSAYVYLGGTAPSAALAGGLDVLVDAGGALRVNGFATLLAEAGIGMESSPSTPGTAPTMTGGTISILADGGQLSSGSITATADALGVAGLTAAGPARGGAVTLGALNGGTVTLLAGQPLIQLTAVARGAVGTAPADATGGDVTVFAQDGTIDANGGAILLSAAAVSGGFSYFGGGSGFAAQGGNAAVEIRAGAAGSGQILAGNIIVNAKGEATVLAVSADPFLDYAGGFTASEISPINGDGGLGTGGTASLDVAAGTLSAGFVSVLASGLGGSSGFGLAGNAPFQSGAGQGGQAVVTQSGGVIGLTGLDVTALGQGGGYDAIGTGPLSLPLAGSGLGGTARVSLAGGTINLANPLAITSLAIGGV
ncbi:MAG: hypothetical protein KKA12_13345, partial [Alphaproteobacteria bacterium]|nr:hypothetical protein [Alphaproteobacteria bacterium]